MSSIVRTSLEEATEQQNSIRRRSLYAIKHLLTHLDISIEENDDHEATNLTSSTLNFLSITKQLSNAEICELSDAALEKCAAEFLEARSTFGEFGNATMGEKFWPTGHYKKKYTYANHPTFIKKNVKLIMVNQRDNKRATVARNRRNQRNQAPEGETSAVAEGSPPLDASQSSTVEQGGRLSHSATANIPTIVEGSVPTSPRIKRSGTPDGLSSPTSFRSSSPNSVSGSSDRPQTPKRRRCDPDNIGKACSGSKATAGAAQSHLSSSEPQSAACGVKSSFEEATIDRCYSIGWDAGVSAVQLQVERYRTEIRRAGVEAETAGNGRKRLNCDHISDALQELLSRISTERKNEEGKMKAALPLVL